MRIGATRLTLHFTRSGEGISASVKEMAGEPLAIRMEIGAHRESGDS